MRKTLSAKNIPKSSIILGALLIVICFVTIYPFYWVAVYSISDGKAVVANPINFLPIKPTLMNYKAVFANKAIMNAFFISVGRTVIGAISHLMVVGLAAYALSKKDLVFRKGFLIFFVITMYFSGGLLPFYVLIVKLNLDNKFLVYILPMLFNGFNMLILKVFFEQLPASLEESAKLDGAGDLTIFTRLVVPLSSPVIATILLFIGVDHWNAWFDAFLFVTKTTLYPLQTLLHKIILESQTSTMFDIMKQSFGNTATKSVTGEAVKMTTVMVATVPILVVYPFLQKYFTKGIMIGAVKG